MKDDKGRNTTAPFDRPEWRSGNYSYMTELLRGESSANTIFCDDEAQPQHTLMESEKCSSFPGKRGRNGLTNRKAGIVITGDQSIASATVTVASLTGQLMAGKADPKLRNSEIWLI
ncbi:hypothetical protein RvY_02167 [Ramazzottius varieornatus]|uniref:Uncharacterized protein n=1 Tax=Ramazzottius varieornatus TaxID=947166 RepID=A0A1D1UTX6_RAMVA|nr:hypothetical protein RvY_02167 [Ramazzottius varieornatus]